MKNQRFDILEFGKPSKTDQGFLKVPVFATRSGVFRYIRPDGTTIRELRPPDEVFDAESMDTLKGVPFTDTHPTELVDSKNVDKHLVGFTSDTVQKHENFIGTEVTITHQKMIDKVEQDGIREVSCGYVCDLEFVAGKTADGEEYDAIQRNIRYNHLAGVERGRAGRDVRLRMDSNAAILDNENQPFNKANEPKKGDAMAKIMLDGVEYEVESGVAPAIKAALSNAKADGIKEGEEKSTAKVDAVQEKLDTAQAKIDTLETENTELKSKKTDSADLQAQVNARMAVLDTAKSVLAQDTKFDEMSDTEIKRAVIVEKTNLDKDDEKLKSDAYVDARFDGIAEQISAEKADGNQGLKNALGNQVTKGDQGDGETTAEEVRQKSMKADSEAWEKPIGFHLNH